MHKLWWYSHFTSKETFILPNRYWYVILNYIIMQFSAYLFVPLFYYITPLNPYPVQVYWCVISFILGLIILLRLLKPDIRMRNNRDAADWETVITWIIAGIIMAYFFQFIAGWIETELLGIKQESENTE